MHGGTTRHVARVAQILVACGLSEDALGCGPLVPREPAAAALLRGPPRRIHHNCSGKHALGLALCVAEGWPLEGYLAEDHPLQRAMRAAVGEAMGVEDLPGAVDGCGMRTYHVPLERLAMAFARLTVGALGAAGTRVAEAMRVHPGLVAFGGALDTELMAAGTGVVAKIGAEAVIGVGTSDGRGLALKVLDGAGRALDPATVLAARALLGLALDTPALTGLAAPRVLNSRGEEVGRLQAQL